MPPWMWAPSGWSALWPENKLRKSAGGLGFRRDTSQIHRISLYRFPLREAVFRHSLPVAFPLAAKKDVDISTSV